MFLKISTINSNDGLPNEQVHAIGQDRNGRVWLAGPTGLACYNGNNIKTYDSRSGLECQGLRTLCITHEGIIWVGTDRGLEAMDTQGKKIKINFSFDWIFGIAESILVCNSIVWVGTSYGLLKLNHTADVLQLEIMEDVGLVSNIELKDANHILAVTGKYGLIEHNGENWKLVNEKLPKADLVTCVKKTLDNFFLVGTVSGLYVLNNAYEITEKFSLPNQNKRVTAIAVKGNDWWIAFGNILALASAGITKIEVHGTENIESKINKLFVDNLGNIWAGTNNAGLKKISCLRKAIQKVDFVNNQSVFCIKKIEQKKKLLIAGDGFCSIINEDMPASNTTDLIFFDMPSIVWDTCIDPVDKQTVWIASESGLYFKKENDSFKRYKDENNKIASPNRVLITRKDEIWLGTISGLFRISNNEVEEVFNINGQSFGYVYSLSLSIDEKIWIGTLGQGLWQETERGFEQISGEHISEKGNTYSISPDQSGNTLIIQDEKVILLDKNLSDRLIIQEFPIAGWSSAWIDDKTIVTGSNDGLIVIDVTKGVVVQRINLHLNKSDWQFTSTRALYFDGNEKLYCGLNTGLYVVNYKNIQGYISPPEVHQDEIVWQNKTPKSNSIGFKIPTGKWSVSISVYAAWFVDERQEKFRFKLVGFDENWSDVTENNTTRYNSLPPGRYELICQAFTNFTGFGEIKTIMFLHVFSPWMKIGLQPVIDKMSSSFLYLNKSSSRNKLLLKQNKVLEAEITERKKIEQELKRYKAELEDIVDHRTQDLKIQKDRAESADKMKSAFLANMSHEIRTPLGVVIGLNNLLQKTGVDETQSDYLKKIDFSAHHLLGIINDILDISKIESGKLELEQLHYSMKTILEELSGFLQIRLKHQDISFIIENKVPDTHYLLGDPLKIKQILINLVNNAFKFTERGSVQLSVYQYSTAGTDYLSFSVSDTGIGMTEKQMKTLFEPFTQADSGIARRYGGTGLGLNISYKYVELMGGNLKVKSQINKGSKFYFTLPVKIGKEIIAKDNDRKTSFNQTIYPDGFDKIRKAKILLAEDEVLNQFILKKILEPEGFQITVACNGAECVDILKKDGNFDLVLMDIQMPEMDGFAATLHIRHVMNDNDIKIIGISANAFTDAKEHIMSSGMNDFISKPINVNELFKKMVKWVGTNPIM